MNEITKLNRFTTLPYLLDIIKRKKIVLTNPENWEDKNDFLAIKHYKSINDIENLNVICFTYENETIHHWSKFSNGDNGCCIEFDSKKLLSIADKNNLLHNKTEYTTIKKLDLLEIDNSKLLFLKRDLFKNEFEYRIISIEKKSDKSLCEIEVDLEIINKITLSYSLPTNVFESLEKIIVEIEPNLKNKINKSTLFENKEWIEKIQKIQKQNEN
ncbi:DUF2971 domain-containing protein [Flavobacterium sp.]|uniref:DUF2971 domain-containing protein n=1 Tax=Flavobacterium sp. TaxID=239 RepID=UPI003751E2A8